MNDLLAGTGSFFASEVLDELPVLVWHSDANGFYTYFNRAWFEFRGRTISDERGLGWIEGVHPEDVRQTLDVHAEAASRKQPFVRRMRLKDAEQEYHWFQDTASPVFRDGEFRGYCGSAIDITDERAAQDKLTLLLEQKETLVAETNHRAKNNFQILSNLLSLEIQHTSEPALKQILQDCVNRLHAIAIFHEKLLDNSEVHDFSKYIDDLAQSVANSYGKNGGIHVRVKVDPVKLNPEKIVACGLLITELLSNAYKHAFPGKGKGEILVNFRRNSATHTLEIVDHGVGPSHQIDFEHPNTVGLQLVSALTRQLGGKAMVECHDGTTIRIQFPA